MKNTPTEELLYLLLDNPTMPSDAGERVLRTAVVRHGTTSRYVVAGDWPAVDGDGWLQERSAAGGSHVEYLIDGDDTFGAMAEALDTVKTNDHFIVLLGWVLEVNEALLPMASGRKSFLEVVKEKAALGARVRVLLYDNPEMRDVKKLTNEVARDALDAVASPTMDVSCFLDDNTRGVASGALAILVDKGNVHTYGAHHQKIMVVYGEFGLIAFCGGIDFHWSRGGGRGTEASPATLHDVHLRVNGAAAEALLTICEKRYQYARDGDVVPKASFPKRPPSKPTHAPYLTQVVETVGNPDYYQVQAHTLWPAIQHAIRTARRYIYIEAQHFTSIDLMDELLFACDDLNHITVLVPPFAGTEQAINVARLKALVHLSERCGPAELAKIGIYQRKGAHSTIHSKLFVFDDEYAIIGSANANHRGYILDSEADVAIAEREARSKLGPRLGDPYAIHANFAHRLRMELWSEHLNDSGGLGIYLPETFDPIGSRIHWLRRPPDAPIEVHTCHGKGASAPWYEAKDHSDWVDDSVEGRIADPKSDSLWDILYD